MLWAGCVDDNMLDALQAKQMNKGDDDFSAVLEAIIAQSKH